MEDNVGDPKDVAGTGCDQEVGVDTGDSIFGVTVDYANSFISVASDCKTTV